MYPHEISNKRILLSALNWGMGHVARTIGLIHKLMDQHNTLFFAGNEHQLTIVKAYFPVIETCELSDYPFEFTLDKSFKMAILHSSISLLKHVKRENIAIDKLVEDFQIDVLISDHRYGCYSRKCTSVFLTHQLQFPLNGWWKLGNYLNNQLMRKFDIIWVPDYPDHRLSGKLSMNNSFKSNSYFIGPLSRFYRTNGKKKNIDLVIVLSGPDEYALEFAHRLFSKRINLTGVIIGKESLLNQLTLPSNLKPVNSFNWKICDDYISSARNLVSACGYSTLMDLEFLKCSASLLPTKGQVEQEYLFNLHANRIGCDVQFLA